MGQIDKSLQWRQTMAGSHLLQRIGMPVVTGLALFAGQAKADISMSTTVYENDTNVPVTQVMAGKPYDLRVAVDTTSMPSPQFKQAIWRPVYRDLEGNALIPNEAYFVDSAKPSSYNSNDLPNDFFEGAIPAKTSTLNMDFSYEHSRAALGNYPSHRNRPVANYVVRVDPSRTGATNEMFGFATNYLDFHTCRVTDSESNQYLESKAPPYHLTVTPATFDVTLMADIDEDGYCDVSDLLCLADSWASVRGDPNYNPTADMDANGAVDVVDLLYLAENFGQTVNPPEP